MTRGKINYANAGTDHPVPVTPEEFRLAAEGEGRHVESYITFLLNDAARQIEELKAPPSPEKLRRAFDEAAKQINEEAREDEPPIGVIPRQTFQMDRIHMLMAAIQRYESAGHKPDPLWYVELRDLLAIHFQGVAAPIPLPPV